MEYFSTNNTTERTTLENAVVNGLAPDGGLYMPAYFERLPSLFFEEAAELSFQEIAFQVAKQLLLGDLPESDLESIVHEAVSFDAPLVEIDSGCYALELFHGPTLAFKDFGARFMARLMSYFMRRRDETLTILVATSGDTGSAVAHGFLNAPNINVILLYPSGKVSHLQEQQLTTMGKNITALEVDGNFDDCQAMVKSAFTDKELRNNFLLSSANSINISRLIPQSFYYVYAYSRIPDRSVPVVFSVPSGNFGNLTAGLFARKIGLPVDRFIAATNRNDIVPAFLNSGFYAPKPSVHTISNAMDVGNPSNFARMQTLFDSDIKSFKSVISGFSYTDEETKACMQKVFSDTGYILDPHGAIGYLGFKEYEQKQKEDIQGIFLETAHPAKFIDVVEETLDTAVDVPERLAEYGRREKKSIQVANTFAALKEYMLSA